MITLESILLYTNDNLIGHSIYHYLIDSYENASRLGYEDFLHGNHTPVAQTVIFNLINKDISVKTAEFIVNTAILYNVDCIVMEHLDLVKKKRGSKKQKLHMWRAKYVQAMVTDKAHRNFIRISRICAWGTSKLAFDGSGLVQRGKSAELPTYSLCRFASGKQYNCDLNASYNIGARYFIRELLKTLPETAEQAATANVPELAHRSTCTLSSLIRLHAELAA